MPRSWKRRSFLTSLAAGGAAALSAPLWWQTAREHLKSLPPEDARLHLRRHFEPLGLDVEDSQLDEFSSAYQRHWYPLRRPLVFQLNGEGSAGYERQMRHLEQIFLLSTDHFLHEPHDAPPALRYVAFFHPYVTPCWNPLRRADRREKNQHPLIR